MLVHPKAGTPSGMVQDLNLSAGIALRTAWNDGDTRLCGRNSPNEAISDDVASVLGALSAVSPSQEAKALAVTATQQDDKGRGRLRGRDAPCPGA